MRLQWLLCCCVLLVGCSRTYFTKEITAEALAGTWQQGHADMGTKLPAREASQTVLILGTDGKFQATGMPLLNHQNAFQYVTDHGRWSLEEHPVDDRKLRWKVHFFLEQHLAQVEWDLVDSGGPIPSLAYIYNVDPDADAEDALILTKVTPKGSAAKTDPSQ